MRTALSRPLDDVSLSKAGDGTECANKTDLRDGGRWQVLPSVWTAQETLDPVPAGNTEEFIPIAKAEIRGNQTKGL